MISLLESPYTLLFGLLLSKRQSEPQSTPPPSPPPSLEEEEGRGCFSCGHIFNHGLLGKYGCPNCHGENKEGDEDGRNRK